MSLTETFYGGQANSRAIELDKKERERMELVLGRKLYDYQWFAMKISGRIYEELSEKMMVVNKSDATDTKDIKGSAPNYLIVEDFVKTEKPSGVKIKTAEGVGRIL